MSMTQEPTPSGLQSGNTSLILDVPALLRNYGEQLTKKLREKKLTSPAEVEKEVREFTGQYAAELEKSDDRGVRASTQDFNLWIGKLFEAVDSGCSHDGLIKQFLDELELLIKQSKSDALFGLVIEQVTDGRRPIGYKLGSHIGKAHPLHWHNFELDLAKVDSSRFLDALFAQESSLPLLLADWIPQYDGLFDSFVRNEMGLGHSAKTGNFFWLTAVSLLAQLDDEPRRIVFLAYRNIGTQLIPNPGKGAGMENRVLDVLRIAYGQIDRQAANVRQELSGQKEEIIKSLYPSIFAHDFMTPVGNIHSFTLMAKSRCAELAQQLLQQDGAADLKMSAAETMDALIRVIGEITKLHQYLRAYASLDLQNQGAWPLTDGLQMAQTLTKNRLQAQQIKLDPDEDINKELVMEVDRSMVIVVLVNLLHNAINIMEKNAETAEQRQAQLRRIQIKLIPHKTKIGSMLEIIVANTDTDIPPENRERIFRKGFSTRGLQGGGRGLHLCRQICAYLGGKISLLTEQERAALKLDAAYRVAFSVRLPLSSTKPTSIKKPQRISHEK